MSRPIVAATGHRLERCYDDDLAVKHHRRQADLATFAAVILRRDWMHAHFIVGMANGWDQAVALACMALGIPFDAAIPFDADSHAQESGTPLAQYTAILARAERVYEVTKRDVWLTHMRSKAYKDRDIFMVDKASEVLALSDGGPGGTDFTMRYALETWGITPENVWPDFEKWKSGGRFGREGDDSI